MNFEGYKETTTFMATHPKCEVSFLVHLGVTSPSDLDGSIHLTGRVGKCIAESLDSPHESNNSLLDC